MSYLDRSREEAEKEMLELCERHSIDVIALAGFMKLFTPWFLENFKGDILNLHPSLLPKYPGTDGIRESWESGDPELGISVISVDKGVDTGPVLLQKSIPRGLAMTLEQAGEAIHRLEHEWYPKAVMEKLDSCIRG
ncbi:MAG: hypothetical protein EHM28_14475 [Spirochaetaceae bacterium]|nr:MAG: hypothetical protein EHM28_14475 [Spirochaetaceae bacterium]